MKIINRYIVKTLFTYISIVAILWLLIFAFFNFLADIDNIGVKQYGFFDSLYVIFLGSALILYKGIIVIILIGVVLALGNLSSTSQLIIFRSSGISTIHIASTVVLFSLFLFFSVAIFGEFAAPKITEYSLNYQARLLGKAESKKINNGFWIKDRSYIVNAEKNYNGENFTDITIIQLKNNRVKRAIKAERMVISDKNVVLGNANIYDINSNSQISFKHYKNYNIDLLFDNKLIQTLKKQPLDLSIVDIYKQVSFLNENKMDSGFFEMELYERMVKPLALIVTILFAMLFIFGSFRDSSVSRKLFLSIAVSLILELYLRISGTVVLKFDYNYAVVVVLPLLIALVVIYRLLLKGTSK